MIWSRALWDIRSGLGDYKANRVIIDAQFDFAPDTSFAAAANATIAKAQTMYGSSAASTVRAAFHARGII
jgi:Zn-dependent metalloprotease